MVARSAASLLFASLAASVALGAPAAHPGARPGEAYTFKFTVGPVEGGRARMSIGRPLAQNGKRVVWVHGEAETTAFVRVLANVKDDYKLSVDLGNLLPLSVRAAARRAGVGEPEKVRSTNAIRLSGNRLLSGLIAARRAGGS